MQTVGWHVEGQLLYSVLIKARRGTPQVIHLQKYPIAEAEAHVKRFYIKHPNALSVTGLLCSDVVTRQFRFNLKSKATLKTALPFQIESNVPFSPEETVAYTLLRKGKGNETFVTLLACREKTLDEHIAACQEAAIDSHWLSCGPQALHRFAAHFFPEESNILLFYVGAEECSYIVIHQGRLVLSQHLPLKNEGMQQELGRVKKFLEKKRFTDLPTVLTGSFSPSLQDSLNAVFPMQLSLETEAFAEARPFALPFGLALDGHYQDKHSVQFRQGSKVSPKIKRRYKKFLTTYLSISLASTLLFSTLKSASIRTKQRQIEQKLCSILNKDVSLESGLEELERRASQPQAPVTTSAPPKVSDVLHWLSHHPLLNQPTPPALEITHINYQLERYPKLGEKKEPFLAKVELEFFSKTPNAARDFHQALLKGDALIDAKKGVVWKTRHDSYYAKFYLKNRRP